jgi:hypothetical protein
MDPWDCCSSRQLRSDTAQNNTFLGLHRPQFADLVLLAAQCVFIIVLPTNSKDYWERLIIPISHNAKNAAWIAIRA